MSNANDNGPPTWAEHLHEQSYGPEAEPKDDFDPADNTVEEVQAYVEANPDQRDSVLKQEKAGKNRSTLTDWLEAQSG